jgi:hypothetical protein
MQSEVVIYLYLITVENNIMKILLKLILFSIFIFITSCSERKEYPIDYKLLNELDSLTLLDYLFDKEIIRINDDGKVIDHLSNTAAADLFGNFYFVGLNYSEIYKFNSEGILLNTFNKLGWGPGEYEKITEIAIDDSGNVFVYDIIARKIIKFDSSFIFIDEMRLSTGFPLSDMEINNNGNLVCYHSVEPQNVIYIYNCQTWELISKFGEVDYLAKKFNSFNGAKTLNIDGNNIFYVNPLTYQINYYDSEQNLFEIIPSSKSHFREITHAINNPISEIRDYSIISCCFKYKDVFFVGINNLEIKNGLPFLKTKFDILSKDGSIIKKELLFKEFSFFESIDTNSFFSVYYSDTLNSKNINPNIIIYRYKK